MIVITSVYNTAYVIETSYQSNQEYLNSQNQIEVTANLIIRDEDLSVEYLNDLSDYMGVEIEIYNEDIYRIYEELSTGEVVYSYITGSTASTTNINMSDELFDQTGLENDYEHNVFLEPAVICSTYLNEFMDITFPALNYDENFTTFDDIFVYFENLADEGETYTKVTAKSIVDMKNPTVSGHWYVSGDLVLSNNDDLVIPDGYVLFVDGKLEMGRSSTLEGVVIVNGNVKIDSDNTLGTIEATIYCKGDFTSDKYLYLGNYYRPSFVFAEGSITLKVIAYYYGFFYSSESITVNAKRTTVYIIGGVYSPSTSSNFSSSEVVDNPYLDESDLYDYGVPSIVAIMSGDSGDGGFIYTPAK